MHSILSPHTQSRLDYLNSVYDDVEHKYSIDTSAVGTSDGARRSRRAFATSSAALGSSSSSSSSAPSSSAAATATSSATPAPFSRTLLGGVSRGRPYHSSHSYSHSHSPVGAWVSDLHQGGVADVDLSGRTFRSEHRGKRLLDEDRRMRLANSPPGSSVEARVVMLESNMRVFGDYLTQLLNQVESISNEVVDQDRRYQSVQAAVSTFQTHVYSAESNRRFDTGMLSQELQTLKRVVRDYVPHAGSDERVADSSVKLRGAGSPFSAGNDFDGAPNRGSSEAGGPRMLFRGPSVGTGGVVNGMGAGGGSFEAWRQHLDHKAEDLFRQLNETLAQQLVTLNRRLLESERQQQQLITSSIAQAQLRFQAMGGTHSPHRVSQPAKSTLTDHASSTALLSSSSSINGPPNEQQQQSTESVQHFLDSVLEKLMVQSTDIHRLQGEQDIVRRDLRAMQDLASKLQPLLGMDHPESLSSSGQISDQNSNFSPQKGTSTAFATRRDVEGLKAIISELQVHPVKHFGTRWWCGFVLIEACDLTVFCFFGVHPYFLCLEVSCPLSW